MVRTVLQIQEMVQTEAMVMQQQTEEQAVQVS
jgi:hypothetical protein